MLQTDCDGDGIATYMTYPTCEGAVQGLQEAAPVAAFVHLERQLEVGSQHWDYWRSLRRRFLKDGHEALTDQETLEILLALASPKPRRNAVLAKALIDRFGNLAGVMGANPRHLSEFPGESRRASYLLICLLKASHVAAVKLMRRDVVDRPIIGSFDSVVRYCRVRMAYDACEEFRILFLNKKNMLILDEAQGRGTVDHVPLYPREVTKRALDVGASAIIMVHNHPSGDPSPSPADIDMTRKVVEALSLFDILVHDHIIVGIGRHISFRSRGLL
ncbi:MAG: DNA repair protein RadC [Geminicoccaceae bacterium]|nr:DNA repair protein RadC [Geminicoccaceae bacterium]